MNEEKINGEPLIILLVEDNQGHAELAARRQDSLYPPARRPRIIFSAAANTPIQIPAPDPT